MDSSFDPADVSTGVSSEPKELIFYIKGLAMVAVTRMGDGVDAVGKDLWVAIVDGSDGRNGRG